ncbi:MAG: nuclear transport factor 2 family protein [Verrucomicrobia bacterium]|jgi:ketosteroid isomerase-like protein|nr:nuclear transport factor 2 family protein [Verrucomicrobiota bacterium]
MKSPLFSATLLVLALALTSAQAATDPTAVWRAADDARVAAMISADPAKLAEVFSDDLLYVHSNGKPDTKTSFVAAISAGRSVYHSVTYEQREFREVSPGLVLMTARCRVQLGKTAPHNELYLSVLAAYRFEKGAWRFLAWQSAKLDAAPAAKK